MIVLTFTVGNEILIVIYQAANMGISETGSPTASARPPKRPAHIPGPHTGAPNKKRAMTLDNRPTTLALIKIPDDVTDDELTRHFQVRLPSCSHTIHLTILTSTHRRLAKSRASTDSVQIRALHLYISEIDALQRL